MATRTGKQLAEYRRRRDFRKTLEPAGADKAAEQGHLYVMHKHAAGHDHFDLRLQEGGVLRSWALPKGASLVPGERRLAIQVEDHPLEYGGFEGIIPQGQYGGGTVMLWDAGSWSVTGKHDADQIDFELHGKKLEGRWTLVRTKGHGKGDEANRNWLLIKRSDKPARVLQLDDKSVASGRTMEEIAADERRSGNESGQIVVAGVRISHPDRVLYREQGVTKVDLARYYEDIADWVVPLVERRPLSLLRCPEGRESECFFQKHPSPSLTNGLPRIAIAEKDDTRDYVYVESVTHLVILVQAGTLELHPWGCHVDDIEHPDLMVFDLDPGPDVAWKHMIDAARDLRDRLDDLGLASFLRTTGGKGLHVVVPLKPHADWEEVKAFARAVAARHARDDPQRLTSNMSKANRQGRIFVDYLRNSRGATAIASYSARARPGAPVAVPVRWDELDASLRPDRYNIHNLQRRLRALESDPWEDFEDARTSLTANMRELVGLQH